MITTTRIKDINAQIAKAIEKIAKKEKVAITFGNSTYSDIQYTRKMTVKTLAVSKVTKDAEKKQNELMAKRICLKACVIGKMIFVGGGEYKVIGYNPRSPKNCLKIEDPKTGKTYKCGARNLLFA